MNDINQNAYLKMLHDLSIEKEPLPDINVSNSNILTTTINDNNNNDLKTDNNYNSATAADDDYSPHYYDNDVEPLTLTHEDDDTLYNDIADAISSL
jgi:hypothetical protein